MVTYFAFFQKCERIQIFFENVFHFHCNFSVKKACRVPSCLNFGLGRASGCVVCKSSGSGTFGLAKKCFGRVGFRAQATLTQHY